MVSCKFSTFGVSYFCEIEHQTFPSEISAETFEGVHEENRSNDDVEVLKISDSTIEKLPENLGDIFKNVENLWIWNNKNLREISMESMKKFPNLLEIHAFDIGIEKIERNLFSFNKNLKEIKLGYKIKEIESGALDSLSELSKFEVGGNQIENIPGDLFKFNKKLKFIDFFNNKTKFIGPDLLDGLNELIWVDFQHNPTINIVYHKEDGQEKLNEMKREIRSLEIPPEMRNSD